MRKVDPRFLLWVDGVGGYLVCLGNELLVGQAAPGNLVDIPILGDLSRRHARIRRFGEGDVLEAMQPVQVNGRSIPDRVVLKDGDELRLGAGIHWRYRRPHALSATARLEPLGAHRTDPFADAILMMSESCVLGPRWTNHVVCRDWSGDVVLSRAGQEVFCRATGPLEVDGVTCPGRGRLRFNSRVVGNDFSMSLEELDKCSKLPLV